MLWEARCRGCCAGLDILQGSWRLRVGTRRRVLVARCLNNSATMEDDDLIDGEFPLLLAARCGWRGRELGGGVGATGDQGDAAVPAKWIARGSRGLASS